MIIKFNAALMLNGKVSRLTHIIIINISTFYH